MEIKKSNKEDISSLMKLIESCVTDMKAKGIYQWNSLYPSLDIISEDIYKEEAYSIKVNGTLAATITLNKEQAPEYKDIPWVGLEPALVIHRLAVHPKYQNQGLGKKLMDFAESFAINKGCFSIRLDVFTKNPISLRLYDRLGYKIRGQVYFPERDTPFYCLEKLL